jgi:predicted RNA-binding Zn ribbon-like protein
MTYKGPLRAEPIAIELHNTIYATSAGVVDALTDGETACAWLEAIAPRLALEGAPEGSWPAVAELRALRTAVRAALQAAGPVAGGEGSAARVAGDAARRAGLDAINRASRRAPRSPTVDWRPGEPPARGTDFHGATRAEVVLAALAADAIELLTSAHREQLRTCGAPGCVLMFLKGHPRREWCSDGCGNRARQARHYERTRRAGHG